VDLIGVLPAERLRRAQRIGVQMSDKDQLHPERSTPAIEYHQPQAKYFSV
jgi:5-methyltetrahydrofolate--homocysteine methyltransferase